MRELELLEKTGSRLINSFVRNCVICCHIGRKLHTKLAMNFTPSALLKEPWKISISFHL